MKKKIYDHPSILKSWLTEKVFGENNPTNRSTFSRLAKSGKWSEAQLAKLEEARKEMVDFLESIKPGKVKK